MSLLPILTVAASGAAATFMALRVNLLKAENARWCSAPLPVRLAMFGTAMVFALHAQAVLVTGAATPTEFLLSLSGAVYAVVMWANLRRQGVTADPLVGIPSGS